MAIAGIDYSLTSPAVCVFSKPSSAKFKFEHCLFFYLTDTEKYAKSFLKNIKGERFKSIGSPVNLCPDSGRYDSISDWAIDCIKGCDQVALEGYAFNATGRVFQLAENVGVLKYKLFQSATPLEVVAPTQVKKFATDKGNASKDLMFDAFFKETGKDLCKIMTPKKTGVQNPVSDIVDAYYICKILHGKINGYA